MSAPTATASLRLEHDDIQGGVLHQRPSPYVGTYLLLRIDDRRAGRELIRRLLPAVGSASASSDPAQDAWVTVAFTHQGLKALGVPKGSLDSFAPEFRQGMAARAAELGEAIWRQDCYQLPTGRTSFGFKDGIGQPAVEGSGIPASNPLERPIKAGEFILGYPDETGDLPPMPTPTVIGRNGTYIVFRKLHTRVAAYRRYLRDRAADRKEEALLGAKMVGRWHSGAPLVLAPDHDDPELGGDDTRNNAFLYGHDRRGLKCPAGAHARRANPRDALDEEGSVDVRLHRMIRRGTSYGPILPDGVLEDDGADRGIIFVFAGSHLKRQFEFVKTQWLNDGIFIGAPREQDPLVGRPAGNGAFTIPKQPIRRRLREMPPFVVTRGGEYCFAPGLGGLRWLAELTI
ncbi:MAG: Dyp-type peroxidase [Actinobacteria bacterium]|nr:MAG: Dyp-type peroxidase [Actinomycetota bacterium]